MKKDSKYKQNIKQQSEQRQQVGFEQQNAYKYINELYHAANESKNKYNQKKERIQRYKAQLFNKATTQYDNNIVTQQDLLAQDLQVPVDGDVKQGALIYSKSCMGCHTLDIATEQYDTAPTLSAIYKKKVATDKRYVHYSSQLLDRNFYWDPINLYRFMYNPSKYFKECNCKLFTNPIQSQIQRGDLIQFLKEYSKQMQTNIKIQLIQLEGYNLYQSHVYANENNK